MFVRKLLLPILAVATLPACTITPPKPHAVEIEPAAQVTKPAPGKALVYFLRTSGYGYIIPSPIYDNDNYIGSIAMQVGKNAYVPQKKTHIAYQAEPGKHMFTVFSENVDFLPADLVAGKTYYVQVRPVIGTWKIRFYLTPQQGQLPQHELDDVLAQRGQLKVTDDGVAWAREHLEDYRKTREEWWVKYQARPASERLELRPQDGR